jgi:lipoprotein signal peptidase
MFSKKFKNSELLVNALGFFILVFIDQYVKSKIQRPFLNFNFVFSLPLPQRFIFLTYAVILFFICVFIFKNFKKFGGLEKFAWLLILAGAASNIGERIIFGCVKDYIYILNGIFNLADGYIILGFLVLLCKNKTKLSKK